MHRFADSPSIILVAPGNQPAAGPTAGRIPPTLILPTQELRCSRDGALPEPELSSLSKRGPNKD